jgi:hypothetical protein
METRDCIKCGPQPLKNFYNNKGKKTNICKKCSTTAVRLRRRSKRAGTYIDKRKNKAKRPVIGETKKCVTCKEKKDLGQFRKYTAKKKGKEYIYRLNRCRDCEANLEANKRYAISVKEGRIKLFDNKEYSDITDAYNRR